MAMKLSPPWIKLYREIQAMFHGDKQVKVALCEYDVMVYVDNPAKASAIEMLLKNSYNFGNVESHVIVIPANSSEHIQSVGGFETAQELYECAFEGNPALSYIFDAATVFGNLMYVVFANKVVQFFNDDLGDVNGMCSTLYQEIAKNIFRREENVYYCTDTAENLGGPLGEWP